MVVFLLILSLQFLLPFFTYAEVIERVVAVVNDDVILLSELNEEMLSPDMNVSGKNRLEVLDEMIDRMLILNEAKRLKINPPALSYDLMTDNDAIINEYIERRVKAFIHINIKDIDNFYKNNRDMYPDKELYDVKEEIEDKLLEPEFKKKLKEHLQELRKKSYIRIQLD